MENDLLAHPDHGRFRSYLHPGIPVHPRVPLCGPLNRENVSSILPAVKNTVVSGKQQDIPFAVCSAFSYFS